MSTNTSTACLLERSQRSQSIGATTMLTLTSRRAP
eukprot:CAMPEP_0170644244 /NCGR_PEP_ID=MMETSP0224-20130122/42366_1 /TAXON_ID=285029 /ORGANISM="Togula jolla, Strain CCCM 725" /LENGTH=34 /DNA_ID= /DNA_START= /DNA_END= /DNA_ORIENTATION=